MAKTDRLRLKVSTDAGSVDTDIGLSGLRALLAALACACLQVTPVGAAGGETARGESAPSDEVAELLVQVDLNQQGLNETVIVLRAGARLLIAAEDLGRWRLRTPEGLPYTREAAPISRSTHCPASNIGWMKRGRRSPSPPARKRSSKRSRRFPAARRPPRFCRSLASF